MKCRDCGGLYDNSLPGADPVRCSPCAYRATTPATLPAAAMADPEVETLDFAPAEAFKECPKCAEPIRERAMVCRFCGFDLERRRMGALAVAGTARGSVERVHVHHTFLKSPGVAAVLAFFWPGLGHLYCGKFGRALFAMFAPLALLILIFLASSAGGRANEGALTRLFLLWVALALLLYFWQIMDAYGCAESMNRGVPRRSRRRRRL